MKKIDKIIVSIIGIASLLFVAFNFSLSLKILAVLIGIAYFFFVAMHLGLALPLFMVMMMTNDIIQDNKVIQTIKESSWIIFFLTATILHCISLFIAYVGVPYIGAFLWNNSLDIEMATQLLEKIF